MVTTLLILTMCIASTLGDPSPKGEAEPSADPVTRVFTNNFSYISTANKNPPKIDLSPPACSINNTKTWCLDDPEYPISDIKKAATFHRFGLLALYDNIVVNTINSIERLTTPDQETFLCPSDVNYVRPLRAINSRGRWRVIVNNAQVYFKNLIQSVRVEECLSSGNACPLVPPCFDTQCIQKSIYHRFLVFDPYDYYFPFAIETFKLPSSCACLVETSL